MFKIQITRKRIIMFLFFLILFFLVFYIGAVIGYYQGSESVSYLSDSEAYITFLALSKLRNGDSTGAIELLETRLDKEIIQCTTAKDSEQSVFNLYWLVFKEAQEMTHGSLLSSIAEYREEYPSISTLPQVRQQVYDILKNASNKTN